MSPDPYAGSYDSSNPQSMNRYAYVLNNPLLLIDPSGQDGCTTSTVYNDDGSVNSVSSVCSVTADDSGGIPLIFLPSQSFSVAYFSAAPLPIPQINVAPSNVPLSPRAQACENKIQGAVNSALNTNSNYLGPTTGPGLSPMGYRNGAYNFNFFAPGVTNPVAGSNGGSGRFPGSGLHIPLPGGQDPTIMPWGYNAQAGGSYFTAHYDSANPTDDLFSFFEHIINDVILRRPHGC